MVEIWNWLWEFVKLVEEHYAIFNLTQMWYKGVMAHVYMEHPVW